MKVPAVRRVMSRLANVEAAIEKQQPLLDTLGHHWEEMIASQVRQHDQMQEAMTRFASQRARIASIGDAVHGQRTQIGALLEQAQAATPEVLRAQQAQIDALRAQLRELTAASEGHSAALAEVSQHLPPAQRANLEATLHGQQLQLGTLNSTVFAQQTQLAALNDLVRQMSTGAGNKSAAVIGAEGGNRNDQPEAPAFPPATTPDKSLEQELLELGGGKGTVYRFDDLLERQESPAPPLIFLHVPKAAGSTLNSLLMKSYKFRADSRGDSFFARYTPQELVDWASVPRSVDDRTRPVFFTGHINLDNVIFRSMPARYVAITLLRDPIERVISHYRFNSTQPSVFQDAIRDEGLSIVDYCRKFAGTVRNQYEVFAPDGGVDVALRRLAEEVSFFGLQSEFGQYVDALGRLLGLPVNPYKMLNMTTPDAAGVTQDQIAELQSLFADDIAFYNRAVEIYHERLARMPKLIAEHPWTRFYS
ncbi:sulfotransferase family 2 domain-containing protein [Bradyrhizobium yuanmingense]|uniref:sulfotransferase family 2 domain-containing protein n=1 Tax=Bradyrhizobium yuanmingense TaxID=108015 RepID=UPI0023B9AD32|nr:sulfotransferase family 2 domain-containing protein [Bradyrhizobium yuanmingense]MDF0517596.1 sulfotransferase family 2 domain-containing protein [Bradyrhizobium yuanmingense]